MPPKAWLKSGFIERRSFDKSARDSLEVAVALALSWRYQAVVACRPGAVWEIGGCRSDEGDVLYYEANRPLSYRPSPQVYPPNHANCPELFLPGITPMRKIIGLRN